MSELLPEASSPPGAEGSIAQLSPLLHHGTWRGAGGCFHPAWLSPISVCHVLCGFPRPLGL